jgi:hypothetical protein
MDYRILKKDQMESNNQALSTSACPILVDILVHIQEFQDNH